MCAVCAKNKLNSGAQGVRLQCFHCSFSLTKKNQKVKADAPLAKNDFRSAKMPELAALKQQAFFNASLHSFS
jgi:hypothetical protein